MKTCHAHRCGEGVPCENVFRFRNRDWNRWRMPDGPEVLVSEEFRCHSR